MELHTVSLHPKDEECCLMSRPAQGKSILSVPHSSKTIKGAGVTRSDVDTYRRGAKVARILLLQLLARWKTDLARSGQGLF